MARCGSGHLYCRVADRGNIGGALDLFDREVEQPQRLVWLTPGLGAVDRVKRLQHLVPGLGLRYRSDWRKRNGMKNRLGRVHCGTRKLGGDGIGVATVGDFLNLKVPIFQPPNTESLNFELYKVGCKLSMHEAITCGPVLEVALPSVLMKIRHLTSLTAGVVVVVWDSRAYDQEKEIFRGTSHIVRLLDKYRNFSRDWTMVVGIDVDDTFSPVVKPGTIQNVFCLAISQNWPVHQLDVKNAFLHGDGIRDSTHPDYVCYNRTYAAYLLLFVDDIVLTALFETLLQQLIRSLHQEFSMTDLGSLNYFLGIFVTCDSSGMFLSQRKYAVEILEKAHMVNCNSSRTPVDTKSKLGDDGDPMMVIQYLI
ncbi:ribonuclease H-like domain-containing protein [Tanacetum coccineum]